MCNVLLIVICPFILFFLPIVLSDLLRFTDSNSPLGIFKLFLKKQIDYLYYKIDRYLYIENNL